METPYIKKTNLENIHTKIYAISRYDSRVNFEFCKRKAPINQIEKVQLIYPQVLPQK